MTPTCVELVCLAFPLPFFDLPYRKVRESTGNTAPLPLLVKIAPDLSDNEKKAIASVVMKTKARWTRWVELALGRGAARKGGWVSWWVGVHDYSDLSLALFRPLFPLLSLSLSLCSLFLSFSPHPSPLSFFFLCIIIFLSFSLSAAPSLSERKLFLIPLGWRRPY